MENPLSVSLINDFVFCPASIYFHQVDAESDKLAYESTEQHEGSALHEKVDNAQYSDQINVLQGVSVYCEEYNLEGKIDIFDIKLDSVYIFKLSNMCDVLKYGYAKHEDTDLLIVK